MWRVAFAVDPRCTAPLAGCSRHRPATRRVPPPGAAQRRTPQAWGSHELVAEAPSTAHQKHAGHTQDAGARGAVGQVRVVRIDALSHGPREEPARMSEV